MIVASDTYRQRLKQSHTTTTTCELLNPGQPTLTVPVIYGQTTADRTKSPRYTADITLDPEFDLGPLLSPYQTRMRLWRGIAGLNERVCVGTYRVQTVQSAPIGGARHHTYGVSQTQSLPARHSHMQLQVTGYGMEAYVMDDTFFSPGSYPGGSALAGLSAFIRGSLPSYLSAVGFTATVQDQYVEPAVWDHERWGGDTAACQMLARACGAEVYADALGNFVCRAIPGMNDALTGTTQGGDGGTLLSVSRSYTRDAVKNVVVVRSSNTSGKSVQDLTAVAWDSDPYSPTYLGPDPYGSPQGTFGRSVMRYDSPLTTSVAQSNVIAAGLLAENRGLVTQTGVNVLPNPTIEPGDVRLVETDLGLETQIIDALTLPVNGTAMQLRCRSTRIVLA